MESTENNLFEIILGTYEEYLLGYIFSRPKGKACASVQTIAEHSHNGSIRCLAYSQGSLASGGADDKIILYNMSARKVHMPLIHHSKTVNTIAYTEDGNYLLSGGQDGMLAFTHNKTYALKHCVQNAHKGTEILDIAIHTSCKIALTLGTDYKIRTWNLLKGLEAYNVNLKTKCINYTSLIGLKWSPDGIHFALYGGPETYIWNINTGGIEKSFKHKTNVSSMCWVSSQELGLGFINGHVSLFRCFDYEEKPTCLSLEAHQARIKCIEICDECLVTASSDGQVKIWEKTITGLKPLHCIETGCRLICMKLIPLQEIKGEEKLNESLSLRKVEDSDEEKSYA